MNNLNGTHFISFTTVYWVSGALFSSDSSGSNKLVF